MGLTCSRTEPCVFYLRDNEIKKLKLVLAVHLDNIINAGLPRDSKWFKKQLQKHFKIKDLGD